MSSSTNELKTCSRCKSTILLKHFEINRKGEYFKLCNNCRSSKHVSQHVQDYNKQVITCGCGQLVSRLGLTRHKQGYRHLNWLKSQKDVSEHDKPLPIMGKTHVCECGCKLSVSNSISLNELHINRHRQTVKHNKRMNWVSQGLDPDVETAREEREEEQRRREYYDNGGHELDWLKQLDWEANLPSNKEWVEEFLKKREHLPEWARHKDKIQAIRDKLLNPPKPPMSEEERARIRARQLAPRTIR